MKKHNKHTIPATVSEFGVFVQSIFSSFPSCHTLPQPSRCHKCTCKNQHQDAVSARKPPMSPSTTSAPPKSSLAYSQIACVSMDRQEPISHLHVSPKVRGTLLSE